MKKIFIVFVLFISFINADSIETIYGKFYILYGEKFIGKKHITIKRYIVSNKEKSITLKVDNFKENYLNRFNGKYVVVDYNSTNYKLLTIKLIKTHGFLKKSRLSAYSEEENIYKKPWTNLLCKFSDVEDEPLTPEEIQGMFRDEYPYLTHYWKQITYNFIDITGTKTVDSWRVLPHKRAYYILNKDGSEEANLTALENDCTNLFKDVYVKDTPVNMFFNKKLDGYSWGGWGQTTWIGGNHIDLLGVIAHEMGHGYGWSHSSGEYGNEYDSPWDVMSDACGNEFRTEGIYKCIPPDTIAFHKEQIGAIKSQYIFDNISNDTSLGYTIHLSREEDLPTEEGSYLIADIYSKDRKKHYTIEARDKVGGYDDTLPAKAILIHRLDGYRAYLIDIDNNGNLADDGAEWKVGEEFSDGNISIKILSESSDGFDVKITAPQTFPDNVKNIIATDDLFDKIKVTWNASKGAKYYEVYRFSNYDLNSSYVKFKTDSNITSFDDMPDDNRWYYYRVKACNNSGCSNFNSWDSGKRATVSNIQATTNRFDKIVVSWGGLKGAKYYKIYRDKNGDVSKAKEIYRTKDDTTSFEDNPNDLNGYYYWVKACNDNGCSLINPYSWGYGERVPVSIIKASGDLFDKVHVEWNGFNEAKYYEVYRFSDKDLNSSYVKFKTDNNATSFDDVPDDYNSYYYRVKACNDNGCSLLDKGYYAVGSRAVVYNIQATTNRFDKIVVSWGGLKGAKYYKIYRDKNGDVSKAKEIYRTKDDTTSFEDNPNDLNGYYYWVKACNDNGCSLINPYSWGYGERVPVSIIKASGDLFDKVHVEWNGFNEAKYYEVYRFSDKDLNSSYVKFKTDNNATSFDDVPDDYNSYYYRVKACNDNGCSLLDKGYYAVGSRAYDKSKFKIDSIPTQYLYENSEITIPLKIEGVINQEDISYNIENSNMYVSTATIKNNNLIIKTYSPGKATIKLTAYYLNVQYSISFNVEVKKSLIKIKKGLNIQAYTKDKLEIKDKGYTIELQQNNNKTLTCKYASKDNYSLIEGSFNEALVEENNITIEDSSMKLVVDKQGRVTLLSKYKLVLPKNFLELGVQIKKKSSILNIKVNNFNEIKF